MRKTYLLWEFAMDQGEKDKVPFVAVVAKDEMEAREKASSITGGTVRLVRVIECFDTNQDDKDYKEKFIRLFEDLGEMIRQGRTEQRRSWWRR